MSEVKPKSKYRWQLIAAIYTVAIGIGVAQVFWQDLRTQWYCSIAMAMFATFWAVSDARRRGHPILHILQPIMFFIWPIAVPIYLIWSRGWAGLGWAVVHAAGLTAATFLGFYITIFAVYAMDGFAV